MRVVSRFRACDTRAPRTDLLFQSARCVRLPDGGSESPCEYSTFPIGGQRFVFCRRKRVQSHPLLKRCSSCRQLCPRPDLPKRRETVHLPACPSLLKSFAAIRGSSYAIDLCLWAAR